MTRSDPVMRGAPALLAIVALCGCASSPDLRRGPEAYDLMQSAATAQSIRDDYKIGPLDVLRVTVLYEPDLSSAALRVDQKGQISLPLLGPLEVAGKTTTQLSSEITGGLGARYLRNPQVTVTVESSSSQKVVVEGDVNAPGVYDITGSASLLEALARAQSPNRVASLKDVVVFRNLGGRRVGAVFDVTRIRAGLDPDPRIVGGDVVVVGFSYAKGAYRDMLVALPGIAAFYTNWGR